MDRVRIVLTLAGRMSGTTMNIDDRGSVECSKSEEQPPPPQVRHVIITGATSGIGRSIAENLAPDHKLVLLGTNPQRLREISRFGLPVSCDLRSPAAALREVATKIAEHFDRIDAVIHCAGIYDGPDLVTVNAEAPMYLIRQWLPSLKDGLLIFMSSSAVFKVPLTEYAASKVRLGALADGLRAEGVRVTQIFPGQTATPMQEAIYRGKGAPYTPKRLLQPDAIAQMVRALLILPAEVTDLHVRAPQPF
jgi:NAD(P)-dependent dehydrogenase (short-subunit alcohol dehydrogenase family)